MNLSQDEILKIAKECGFNVEGDKVRIFPPQYHSVSNADISNTLTEFANAIQSHSGGEGVAKPLRNENGSLQYDRHGDVIYEVNLSPPQLAERVSELELHIERLILLNDKADGDIDELQATNAKLVEQIRDMRMWVAQLGHECSRLGVKVTIEGIDYKQAIKKAGD